MPGEFTWPTGMRAAAAFTFDLDAESCALAADRSNHDRMSLMSHQSYGPQVAVPRLLEILARQDVTATFFVPGLSAEMYPDTVRRIVDAGHEVAHHGYTHEPMGSLTRRQEARVLDRGLEALDAVAGVRPVGYRAPWWELNWHTPELLLERGFRYESSLLDGDRPYVMGCPDSDATGSLVEIPVDWALDDWEQYAFYPGWTGSGVIESPVKAKEMWFLEAQAMHRENGCFVLTNHPFLSGRPGRAHQLEELIERTKALPGMWVTTLERIAEHTASLGLPTYRHRRMSAEQVRDAFSHVDE
ncbi:peptidoglycan/xylan/chitin deacetylase (PgdA/CDA1 family) [Prauserella isguenensis]|uniref:Peptidoglycan/xylan/chitin deacetylase (PgdA/CDA1 family) n=1 Tax=Prauserella isguenensis TaxID=1470180 RepID=A0A839RZV4_9PSEU|nr:polysaccharide deacetylase [Prauserella isguenensis]MBB3050027.1 peptidoglycan/xylan/chitin deacetylase (PgdA/CDA1 family) [Prauserella isguenensis]